MSLKEKLSNDLKTAMKAGQSDRVGVLRMVRARILEKEVELRTRKGRDYQLDDQETTEVISNYAKQRRQSIESYRQAARPDLAEREEAELEILQEYLPRQLDHSELVRLIENAIQESGARSLRDLGVVMKLVMPRLKGAADGAAVSEMVRRKLSN